MLRIVIEVDGDQGRPPRIELGGGDPGSAGGQETPLSAGPAPGFVPPEDPPAAGPAPADADGGPFDAGPAPFASAEAPAAAAEAGGGAAENETYAEAGKPDSPADPASGP